MALQGNPSHGDDPDIRVIGSEKFKVTRIVRENKSATEPNRGGNHEGIDRRFAVLVCGRQKVAGNPRYPHPRCHHPGEPASKHMVDRLVRSRAPVELDEDGRRDPHRDVPALGAPQRRPDPLMTAGIASGTGQRRERLRVKDQDGQSAS